VERLNVNIPVILSVIDWLGMIVLFILCLWCIKRPYDFLVHRCGSAKESVNIAGIGLFLIISNIALFMNLDFNHYPMGRLLYSASLFLVLLLCIGGAKPKATNDESEVSTVDNEQNTVR